MEEILAELESGSTVLLEIEKLPEFWYYCSTLKSLFAFDYVYSETTVKITMNKNDTILYLNLNKL